MMKSKTILYSLWIIFFMAVPLVMAVRAASAWEVKTIDYETHLNSTDLANGSYLEKGEAWRNYDFPIASNGGYRFLSHWEINLPRTGMAFWLVKIPRNGWYKLETSYRVSENRTPDADYAVYVNKTTADVEALKAIPEYAVSVSQVGETSVPWLALGTYCLQQGDVSMIVLDGRDDNYSDSADAGRWTYMGTENNSQYCGGQNRNMAPINYLLLKSNV